MPSKRVARRWWLAMAATRSPEITLPAGTSTLSVAYNVVHDVNSGPDDYLRIRVVDGTTVTVG